MIFITVGTHEQPFNRLLKEIDRLVGIGVIREKVIIQRGYTEYKPTNCEYYDFMSAEEMHSYINKARIVITHGGPASFLEVLRANKIPIVVPRMKKYNEHINNHQVEFVRFISSKRKNIIPVYNIKDLRLKIENYKNITLKMSEIPLNNTESFNSKFIRIIEKLMDK